MSKEKRGLAARMRPLSDKVLVRRCDTQDRTAGGIYIPDVAKERPQRCTVEAVGPGKLDDAGKRVPLQVKIGDQVLIKKFGGGDIRDPELGDMVEFLVVSEDDILSVVDPE